MRRWPLGAMLHGGSPEKIATSNSNVYRSCFVCSVVILNIFPNMPLIYVFFRSSFHSTFYPFLGKNTKKGKSLPLVSRLAQELPFGLHSLFVYAHLRGISRGCYDSLLGLRDEVVLVHGAHPQTKSFTGNGSLGQLRE